MYPENINPEKRAAAVRARSLADFAYFTRVFWPACHGGWDPRTGEPLSRMIWGTPARLLCDHAQEYGTGYLLVNIPPGCSKTMIYAVMFAAWSFARDPDIQILYMTSTGAQVSVTSMKLRNLMGSREFRITFPHVNVGVPDDDSKREDSRTGFSVGKSGAWRGRSHKSQITGLRCNILIVDDLNLPGHADSSAEREEVNLAYSEKSVTRRAPGKPYREIVIQQRICKGDLTDHILSGGGAAYFERLCLPMTAEEGRLSVTSAGKGPEVKWAFVPGAGGEITTEELTPAAAEAVASGWVPEWRTGRIADLREPGELLFPELFTADDVAAMKARMSAFAWDAQYRQAPSDRASAMFDADAVRIVDDGEIPEGGREVRGWDIAYSKKDKTASVRLKKTGRTTYVTDVTGWNLPLGANERRAAEEVAAKDGRDVEQNVPQDPGAAGKTAVRSWTSVFAGWPVRSSVESGSKGRRASPFASAVNNGEVVLRKAPWNAAFLQALRDFTEDGGPGDDYVDAASRAFSAVTGHGKRKTAVYMPRVITQASRPL